MSKAEYAMKVHKKAVEQWNEGEIADIWEDISGYLCVRYQSGEFWHYKDLETESPVWW